MAWKNPKWKAKKPATLRFVSGVGSTAWSLILKPSVENLSSERMRSTYEMPMAMLCAQ